MPFDAEIVHTIVGYRERTKKLLPIMVEGLREITEAVRLSADMVNPQEAVVLQAFLDSMEAYYNATQAHIDTIAALAAQVSGAAN